MPRFTGAVTHERPVVVAQAQMPSETSEIAAVATLLKDLGEAGWDLGSSPWMNLIEPCALTAVGQVRHPTRFRPVQVQRQRDHGHGQANPVNGWRTWMGRPQSCGSSTQRSQNRPTITS
jgi:hypothetical protein